MYIHWRLPAATQGRHAVEANLRQRNVVPVLNAVRSCAASALRSAHLPLFVIGSPHNFAECLMGSPIAQLSGVARQLEGTGPKATASELLALRTRQQLQVYALPCSHHHSGLEVKPCVAAYNHHLNRAPFILGTFGVICKT